MKVKALSNIIQALMPAVDNRGLVKEHALVNFEGDSVWATDGSLYIRRKLPEEVGPDGFSIEAQTFAKLLKSLDEEDIDLKQAAQWVTAKTEHLKGTLPLIENEPLVSLDVDVKKWNEPNQVLFDGMVMCRHTASRDVAMRAMFGVRVHKKAIYSCDHYRLSYFSILDEMPSMVVSVDLLDYASKFLTGKEPWAVHNDMFFFQVMEDDEPIGLVGGRLLEGDYPDQKIWDSAHETGKWDQIDLTARVKKEIQKAVKRQNLIQGDMKEFFRTMTLSVSGTTLTLESKGAGRGSLTETIELDEPADKPFSFQINPVFLMEVFEVTEWLMYSEEERCIALEGEPFDDCIFDHYVHTKNVE